MSRYAHLLVPARNCWSDPTYNRQHREMEGRREGADGLVVAKKAAVMAVEQRGPAVGIDSDKKEGKGE